MDPLPGIKSRSAAGVACVADECFAGRSVVDLAALELDDAGTFAALANHCTKSKHKSHIFAGVSPSFDQLFTKFV